MKDIFERIHELLRKSEYRIALDSLLTNNHKSIKSPYDSDVNHAWYLVGDTYYLLGDFQHAVSAFKKALALCVNLSLSHAIVR